MNSKLLTGILVVSVSLNLALVGFLIGKQARPAIGLDPTRGYAHWLHTLPVERQADLRPILRESYRRGKPLRMRRLHKEFRTVLVSDPLDQAALISSLEKIRGRHQEGQAVSHEAFAKFVGALTLSERQLLAEELSKGRHPHRRGRDFRP